jgi:hypothetical protein
MERMGRWRGKRARAWSRANVKVEGAVTGGVPEIICKIHVGPCTIRRMPDGPAMLINGASGSRPHEVSLILELPK